MRTRELRVTIRLDDHKYRAALAKFQQSIWNITLSDRRLYGVKALLEVPK